MNNAIKLINGVAERGCHFSLDDFGCGLSSFYYLKNLPVQYLKIDGNFVRDIHKNPVGYSMVEAINNVGHVMGLKTIAEFAESEEVLEKLKEIGVDYAQGYVIGHPQPWLCPQ
jgi:EAL domain-containing protein (putative c-di-GMP-specific phosphodiesterase class I)